mgnify:CR=1 FL=1
MKKTLGGLMVALCLCLAGCAAHGQHTSQPVSASQSTPPTLGQHTASAAVPAQSDDASEGADASSADSTEPLPPTEDAQQPTSQAEQPSEQTVTTAEKSDSSTKTVKKPKETTEKATKPATKNDKTTTKDSTSQPAEPKQDTTAPVMTGYLPRGDVIQIALRHAGLKQADICDLSCKLEDEDGVMIYQVEFEHGKYEYEYEIDAKSGKILDVEVDD